MGVPRRQSLFKIKNTSSTHFDPLYPILELWHKEQSNSEGEKDKCGYTHVIRADET